MAQRLWASADERFQDLVADAHASRQIDADERVETRLGKVDSLQPVAHAEIETLQLDAVPQKMRQRFLHGVVDVSGQISVDGEFHQRTASLGDRKQGVDGRVQEVESVSDQQRFETASERVDEQLESPRIQRSVLKVDSPQRRFAAANRNLTQKEVPRDVGDAPIGRNVVFFLVVIVVYAAYFAQVETLTEAAATAAATTTTDAVVATAVVGFTDAVAMIVAISVLRVGRCELGLKALTASLRFPPPY